MVRSVDVARHMEVSKPSVCHAVATLRDGGFLTMDEDHFLHLTDVGREVAEKIYERHCFFTEQLIAAGVDPRLRRLTPAGLNTLSAMRAFHAAERGSRTGTNLKPNKPSYPAPQDAPEEYLCRMETLHELMAVLDTCTEAQRRRFLLYALDGLSLAEIGVLCGCSKVAVYQSVEAVRKKFINFFESRLNE